MVSATRVEVVVHRAHAVVFPALFLALLLPWGQVSAQQGAQENFTAGAHPIPGSASLRICLRLPDDSPFSGSANVRVLPEEGYEVTGAATESEGEMIFPGMRPGTYQVEVNASGFLTVRRNIRIEPGHPLHTLTVIMEAKPLPAAVAEISPSSPAPVAALGHASWAPPDLDDAVPDVDPDVECPLPQVVRGVGQRMKQLVSNLEKFAADERVEHFVVDSNGVRRSPDVRNFQYVVLVSQNSVGTFLLEEYRNGSVALEQFPAHIATEGLPGMALIFHPLLAPDFKFVCEGLGEWRGRRAWQIHFVQRPDRPRRIRAYVIAGRFYPLSLKGRAWVDPGTHQLLRLESELARPLKEIELSQEHVSIDYGPVQFHSQNQRLWLPQTAELYVERQGRRYYRRHTFSNFQIFMVETAQNIQPPTESYGFTNTTDRDIVGVLTVTPASGVKLAPVSIAFTIPAWGSVFKLVGPGRDISIPVESVGSATFAHNGPADAVRVDAHLIKESTLDVIPDSPVPIKP
jgi:hypothetical protein